MDGKVDIMDVDTTEDGIRIRELSIVIAAQNHNPTILNPDFLARNEIAQTDWQLAQAPVCVEPFAEVQYANGISVVSESQKIIFTQPGESLTQEDIIVVKMAHQYVKTVPHVDYRGVGINPKGDIGFPTKEASRRYIMGKLIAAGPWQSYGKAPVRGSATFLFELEATKLFLGIQEAERRDPNGTLVPVVVFSGNFHYALPKSPKETALKALSDVLDSWEICWREYTGLVNSVFM